ncbi:MAG TPA: cytochrome b/b6 domain-containing protein [Allocoleopsis sp.]
MNRSQPYQPLILRIFHSISAILAIGAIISGFLVYNTFDARFGKLPMPPINPIQDIHGTLALFFLIFLPFFALYSFHAGKNRLIQDNFLANLTRFNTPIWWVNLQRLVNTKMLIFAVLAVISGRMMKEEWLPLGEFNHIWYSLHLITWVIMILALAIHLLMSAKIGGTPLLLSMLSWQFREADSPINWYSRLTYWLKNFANMISSEFNQFRAGNLLLKIIEVMVLGGILIAFILPLFLAGGK